MLRLKARNTTKFCQVSRRINQSAWAWWQLSRCNIALRLRYGGLSWFLLIEVRVFICHQNLRPVIRWALTCQIHAIFSASPEASEIWQTDSVLVQGKDNWWVYWLHKRRGSKKSSSSPKQKIHRSHKEISAWPTVWASNSWSHGWSSSLQSHRTWHLRWKIVHFENSRRLRCASRHGAWNEYPWSIWVTRPFWSRPILSLDHRHS